MASSWIRSLTCITVAAALVLAAAPAGAQKKKKRRKKPAVTAPVKSAPATAPPATAPPGSAPKTASPPAAAAESETEEKSGEAAAATAETSVSSSAASHPDGESPFSLLEVSVGVRGFQRHLSYTDDVFGRLPSYDLSGAPAGRVGVAVYPLRTATLSVGVVGFFEYAFALGSTYKKPPGGQAEGTKYTTSSMQYAVGLRGNYLLGAHTVFAGVDYLAQSFTVGLPASTTNNAGVPDVKYTAVHPNVGARIAIADKFAVLAGVGYLLVLDAGQIISPAYFAKQRSSVGGVDLNVGLSYAFSPHLELRPSVDYRRYFYKFKPLPEDPWIAGGALDQYIGVSVNAAYIF